MICIVDKSLICCDLYLDGNAPDDDSVFGVDVGVVEDDDVVKTQEPVPACYVNHKV